MPYDHYNYSGPVRVTHFFLFQRKDNNAGATLTTRPSAAINLVIAILDTNRVLEKISVAVSLPSFSIELPCRSTVLPFQRRDRSAGAILTTRPSVVSHLAMASLDTNSAMGRIIAAVRTL